MGASSANAPSRRQNPPVTDYRDCHETRAVTTQDCNWACFRRWAQARDVLVRAAAMSTYNHVPPTARPVSPPIPPDVVPARPPMMASAQLSLMRSVSPSVLGAIAATAGWRLRKRWFWAALPLVASFLVVMQMRRGMDHFKYILDRDTEFVAITAVAALLPLVLLWVAYQVFVMVSPQRSRAARVLGRPESRPARCEVIEMRSSAGPHAYVTRNRILAATPRGQRVELNVTARSLSDEENLRHRTRMILMELQRPGAQFDIDAEIVNMVGGR
jgi:hypothetical protein